MHINAPYKDNIWICNLATYNVTFSSLSSIIRANWWLFNTPKRQLLYIPVGLAYVIVIVAIAKTMEGCKTSDVSGWQNKHLREQPFLLGLMRHHKLSYYCNE